MTSKQSCALKGASSEASPWHPKALSPPTTTKPFLVKAKASLFKASLDRPPLVPKTGGGGGPFGFPFKGPKKGTRQKDDRAHLFLFGNKPRSELGPVVECIFYCLLHFESLVKCKLYPKSTPETNRSLAPPPPLPWPCQSECLTVEIEIRSQHLRGVPWPKPQRLWVYLQGNRIRCAAKWSSSIHTRDPLVDFIGDSRPPTTIVLS